MQQQTNFRSMPLVTVAAVVIAIVLSFIGSGVLGGTPISEAADGALSAEATPFAPAGPAFSIWSAIYAGLTGYAIFQLLPAQRHSERHIQLRPWAASSAVLNAAWIGAIQLELLLVSVTVIVVLLAVLLRIVLLLRETSPSSTTDTLFTHGTFGVYLGWVWVATTANIAAWLASLGFSTFPGWEWGAVAILVVVAIAGLWLAGFTRGFIAPSLAISWGLAWLAVARTDGAFTSPIIVWTAAIAAAVVLVSTIVLRLFVDFQRGKTGW